MATYLSGVQRSCSVTRWAVIVLFAFRFVCAPASGSVDSEEQSPGSQSDDLSAPEQDAKISQISSELKVLLGAKLKNIESIDEKKPTAVDEYSRRGDLRMFLGEFKEAEADYSAMVRLKPEMDVSHWRLGIAMYFAGHAEEAASQFDKYHSFDNVDRENGIWRYFSHRAAFGKEKAKEQLLKYEKDDRPPFREVYQLFDGSLSPTDVLASISLDLPDEARQTRLFYAHLYIGLNCAADNDRDQALASLRIATLNPWPRKAGFGPEYMWHVGRLRYAQLKEEAASDEQRR